MTRRILVVYASKHGATAEIAEAIADQLRAEGLEATCADAGEVENAAGFDAVVLGSAVYMKRWRPEARRFLRKHHDELAERPFWVFSSGYIGEKRDPAWEEPHRIIDTAEKLGVREHVTFGGRVPQNPGNFVERAMLRDTPPELADQRDFEAIRAWASSIATAVTAADATSPDPAPAA